MKVIWTFIICISIVPWCYAVDYIADEHNGPGADCTKISVCEALASSPTTDRILVRPGSYVDNFIGDDIAAIISTDGPSVTFLSGDGVMQHELLRRRAQEQVDDNDAGDLNESGIRKCSLEKGKGDATRAVTSVLGAMVGTVPEPTGKKGNLGTLLITPKHRLFLRRYGFLSQGLVGQYAWWEVLELGRKLVLTSLLVFLMGGSTYQLALVMLTCGIALGLHLRKWPYLDRSLARVQMSALSVLTLVIFVGLVYKAEPSTPDWLGSILIPASVGLVFLQSMWEIAIARPRRFRKVRVFREKVKKGMTSLRHSLPGSPLARLGKSKLVRQLSGSFHLRASSSNHSQRLALSDSENEGTELLDKDQEIRAEPTLVVGERPAMPLTEGDGGE